MKCWLPLSGFGKWTFLLYVDQAAKSLKLFPHEYEFASPWATIPGHSDPKYPGISACVAVGSLVAAHGTVLVRAVGQRSYTALSITFFISFISESFWFSLQPHS